MAHLGQTIDANEIAERQDFEALPAGRYRLMITSSDMKPTKDGTGEYLQLEMDVQTGPCQGRKLFERLNLKNNNPQTVDIAYRTLGEIQRAVGKLQIQDSVELHNAAFEAEVDIEPGKPYTKDNVTKEGRAQNRIRKYMPIGSGGQASSNSAQPANQAQPAQTGNPPPWKRK